MYTNEAVGANTLKGANVAPNNALEAIVAELNNIHDTLNQVDCMQHDMLARAFGKQQNTENTPAEAPTPAGPGLLGAIQDRLMWMRLCADRIATQQRQLNKLS